MFTLIGLVLSALRNCFRARIALQAEIIALRHQFIVIQRKNSGHRIRMKGWDRIFWVWLSRLWDGWQSALLILKPQTVIAWHRKGFRLYWTWKSSHPDGRPPVSFEVRDLIRKMSLANPRWGAPRIHKIGIKLSEATVAKYMARHREPPSQTWRTFLTNHMSSLASADFFVVPTITFQLLFVFVILSHDRRRPIHCAVTKNPTADWAARQTIEAFPWDSAPRHLLHDRDCIYGEKFNDATESLGIREVLTAPRSPWQSPYIERFIGSVRRECLDHIIIINRTGLRRVLTDYFEYYERSRTHLSLEKDAPVSRPIQPESVGRVIEIPMVGGLHHRYERHAA